MSRVVDEGEDLKGILIRRKGEDGFVAIADVIEGVKVPDSEAPIPS